MSPKATDPVTLRKYLLGQLPEEEQEVLELWLLSEADAYDLVAAAEDDLIDDSITGRLNAREQDQFRNHFLLAPERQQKLEFAQRFRSYLNQQYETSPSKAPSFFEQAVALFRYHPAFAASAALVAVTVFVGGVWAVQLQSRLSVAEGQMAELQHQRDNIGRQLGEANAQHERIAGQFARLQTALTELGPSLGTGLMTLNLAPSVRTRSEGNVTAATITPNTHLVRFSLSLPDSNVSTYRVVLADDGDEEILRVDKVTATATSQGKVLVLTVSPDDLRDGDYNLKVMSVVDPASPEVVASYSFRSMHTAK
jgi:hypothetical protein